MPLDRAWLVAMLPCLGCGCTGASPVADAQSPATVVTLTPVEPRALQVDQEPSPAPSSPDIWPALQIDGLRPGMSLEELYRAVGQEAGQETEADARVTWESAGYDTRKQLEFLVGFDRLLLYNDGGLPIRLPLWKVFLRGGRVALLKFTMYVPGSGPVEAAGFPPSCYLNSSDKGIEETFGNAYVFIDDRSHDNRSHHYPQRGISVIAKEGKIAVLDVYEPVGGARREALTRALRGSALESVTEP